MSQRMIDIPSDPNDDKATPIVLRLFEVESNQEVRDLAEREKAIVLAFIAPQVPYRVSPAQAVSASISLFEEFAIEEILNMVKAQVAGKKKLLMLINSPGGLVSSSYKVAKAIADNFDEITVFVPYTAMSGGTLIALSGQKIGMGMMSSLGPVDVQIPYKGNLVSATSFLTAFYRSVNKYRVKSREEMPYPEEAMVQKFDPIIMEEASRTIAASVLYIDTVLNLAHYDPTVRQNLINCLVWHDKMHGTVISFDEADDMGLRVERDSDYPSTWPIMRKWLHQYLLSGAMTHHIRYYIPDSVLHGAKKASTKQTKPMKKPAKKSGKKEK